MYEFVTHTWNPVAGSCPHVCGYCYVSGLKKNPILDDKYSGPPQLVEKELCYPHGEGKTIFVCNMTDLFAEAVPIDIIRRVMVHTKLFPENTYLFQSKNPARFHDLIKYWPKNPIFCTTIESNWSYPDTTAPSVRQRAIAMSSIRHLGIMFPSIKFFLTIEPIMDFDLNKFASIIAAIKPDMVSIGADSQHCGLQEPSKKKIEGLILRITPMTKVYQKPNLKRLQDPNR